MPDRNLTAGSAAAIAILLFFAGQDAAQAARCPLGEIYRPSRGVCVSKQQAIQAGVYRESASRHVAAPMRVAALVTEPETPPRAQSAQVETPPAPKPRPQALVEIERRAPVAKPKADEALAFLTEWKPAKFVASNASLQMAAEQPRPKASELAFRPQDASPFGSLVALEPMP
jgi:hypothetical protein